MSLSYTEMKMNVDLKSDSSRGIGVDMFNHSNDEDEDNSDEVEDDDDDDDDEDDDDEDNDGEYQDDDDDHDDDDDDDGDNEDEDEAENGVYNSNGCNILDVKPRDLQINHNSSALHMSSIHWPPGSWQDGTRRSAFQPYRVSSIVVDIDNKIKDLFVSNLLTLR
jgi:hypothetical protein